MEANAGVDELPPGFCTMGMSKRTGPLTVKLASGLLAPTLLSTKLKLEPTNFGNDTAVVVLLGNQLVKVVLLVPSPKIVSPLLLITSAAAPTEIGDGAVSTEPSNSIVPKFVVPSVVVPDPSNTAVV